MSLDRLLSQQKSWAIGRVAKGHILDSIADNLFRPLNPATFKDFGEGAGDELGGGRRTAKMRSLRSSSAFACNIFDPWRGRDLRGLVSALGLESSLTELAFEFKVRHGLRTKPPHLDVMLSGTASTPVGIEIKFAEPYGRAKPYPPLDPKYFPPKRKRWTEVGLPQTQEAAESVGRAESFARLNAPQLVKHILGIGRVFRSARPVRLRYLWYDVGGDEAAEHGSEVSRFAAMVAPEIDFAEIRFQDFFVRLAPVAEPVDGYLAYLRSRYYAV